METAAVESTSVPSAFILRRLHSLTGFWLVLFLIEHLLTNSQAALFVGEDGAGFVRAVNAIKNFPYLPLIELFLLGVPILIHMIWGLKYLRTSVSNSSGSGDTKPRLTYGRNRAFTWQRITSWILLFGLVGHVVHMRFVEYPSSVKVADQTYYMNSVRLDAGLSTVAPRLGVKVYAPEKIRQGGRSQPEKLLKALEKQPVRAGEGIAVSDNFGTATLLMVRESFRSPFLIVLYTIFVLTACFHGFNGLWTFLITWGVALTERSQKLLLRLCTGLMFLVGFLGLAAVWGTYWINLRY